MSEAPFKVFQDKIDRQDYEKGLKKIAQQLRPNWDRDKIKIKEYKEGVIHRVLCCYHEDDEAKNDALMFRIFPDGDLYFYIDGDENQVVLNQQLANASGNGPQLYATFANGTVSSFIKGTTMKNSDFKDINIIRQITDHIARLHLVDTEQDFFDFYGKPTKYQPRFKIIEVMRDLLKYVPDTCRDPEKRILLQKHFKVEDLSRDIDYVEDFIQRADLPMCHSHYDLHKNNMIIDRESGKITFIDFDVGGLMFECTDIQCFMEGDSVADEKSDGDIPAGLSEEELLTWIKCYLEAKNRHQGKEEQEVTEEAIRKFRIQCQIVKTLTLLPVCIWPLNGFEDFTLYDSWGLALKSRKEFLDGKQKLEELLLQSKNIAVE